MKKGVWSDGMGRHAAACGALGIRPWLSVTSYRPLSAVENTGAVSPLPPSPGQLLSTEEPYTDGDSRKCSSHFNQEDPPLMSKLQTPDFDLRYLFKGTPGEIRVPFFPFA